MHHIPADGFSSIRALAQNKRIGRVAEKHTGRNRRVLWDIDISSKENAHNV